LGRKKAGCFSTTGFPFHHAPIKFADGNMIEISGSKKDENYLAALHTYHLQYQ
jgi:hypothetical protein